MGAEIQFVYRGQPERLEVLWFPFRDPAQSGEVPEDLTDAAIAMERIRELDEKEADRLRAL